MLALLFFSVFYLSYTVSNIVFKGMDNYVHKTNEPIIFSPIPESPTISYPKITNIPIRTFSNYNTFISLNTPTIQPVIVKTFTPVIRTVIPITTPTFTTARQISTPTFRPTMPTIIITATPTFEPVTVIPVTIIPTIAPTVLPTYVPTIVQTVPASIR